MVSTKTTKRPMSPRTKTPTRNRIHRSRSVIAHSSRHCPVNELPDQRQIGTFDLLRRSDDGNLAFVQQTDSIGDLKRAPHIVGDYDRRDLELPVHIND